MAIYGITSTLPIEIIYAAGHTAVDLNNLFINSPAPNVYLQLAERAGFPANSCAWVKGIFGYCQQQGIKKVVGVNVGDCSQNSTLLDILSLRGVEVLRFSYFDNTAQLAAEIAQMEQHFGVTRATVAAVKQRFDEIRAAAKIIDERAWQQLDVPSEILFTAQLALTDFAGAPEKCAAQLRALIAQLDAPAAVKNSAKKIPLAVVGVPTIIADLWTVIENFGGRVVYHEIPQQFSLAENLGQDIVASYANYTYPATAAVRLAEIERQIKKRGVRGIIHYAQAFCHRQLHDMLLREKITLPILTIEADCPCATDGRTLTRLEAFLEQLR